MISELRSLLMAAHSGVPSQFPAAADGRSFRLGPTLSDTQRELARFSRARRRAPARLLPHDRTAPIRCVISSSKTPPNRGGGWRDWLHALGLGGSSPAFARSAQRDLWELVTRSAGDVIDYWFERIRSRRRSGSTPQVGHFASPYSPGSAYVLLHHAFGEVNGKARHLGTRPGGMGGDQRGDSEGGARARRGEHHRSR